MIISQAKNSGIDLDIIKLMVGKSIEKDIPTYVTGIDGKTAFNKLQKIVGNKAFTEESEDIVQATEAEIAELTNYSYPSKGWSRLQESANDTLTERLNEYEIRLKEHGEIPREIPTMRKQIAYLKAFTTQEKKWL